MSIKPITTTCTTDFSEAKQRFRGTGKKSKQIKTPAFYCRDCNSNCNNYCAFYSRPIDPNFNRRFNHSHYSPVAAKFEPPKYLKEMMEQEEKEQGCVA